MAVTDRTMRIRDLLRQAVDDPLRSQQCIDLALRELNSLTQGDSAGAQPNARAPATRILKVPGLSAIAPGGVLNNRPLDFSRAGLALAMYGTTLADGSNMGAASILVNIKWLGGDKPLVSTGEGDGQASFQSLFPRFAPWFPVLIRVSSVNTKINVSFTNVNTQNTYTPELLFSFIDRSHAKALGIWPWRGDKDDQDEPQQENNT